MSVSLLSEMAPAVAFAWFMAVGDLVLWIWTSFCDRNARCLGCLPYILGTRFHDYANKANNKELQHRSVSIKNLLVTTAINIRAFWMFIINACLGLFAGIKIIMKLDPPTHVMLAIAGTFLALTAFAYLTPMMVHDPKHGVFMSVTAYQGATDTDKEKAAFRQLIWYAVAAVFILAFITFFVMDLVRWSCVNGDDCVSADFMALPLRQAGYAVYGLVAFYGAFSPLYHIGVVYISKPERIKSHFCKSMFMYFMVCLCSLGMIAWAATSLCLASGYQVPNLEESGLGSADTATKFDDNMRYYVWALLILNGLQFIESWLTFYALSGVNVTKLNEALNDMSLAHHSVTVEQVLATVQMQPNYVRDEY